MIRLPAGKFCSVKEYAKKSGITRQTVYNALKQGRLKAYKVSDRWIIPSDSLIINRRIKTGNQIGVSNLRRGDLEGFLEKRGIELE